MKKQRTNRQKAYDIWKSIEYTFEDGTTRKFSEKSSKENRQAHFKKLGDVNVKSGHLKNISPLGGRTVTPKKLESIRKSAEERRMFSNEEIIEMKDIYRNDISIGFPELAEKYECSVANIHLIMNGEIYQGIGGDVIIRVPKIKCPHCNKLQNKTNYKRWHGDKCKLNPNKK